MPTGILKKLCRTLEFVVVQRIMSNLMLELRSVVTLNELPDTKIIQLVFAGLDKNIPGVKRVSESGKQGSF